MSTGIYPRKPRPEGWINWNKGLPKEMQPGYGRQHSKEIEQKLVKAMNMAWKGKHHTKEAKTKMSAKASARVGAKNPRWITDRNLIKGRQIRNNPEYKQWRKDVWTRDNFRCKINNSDCKGKIEAHHILGWSEYPELRYKINNGITLCHAHHPRKRAEEKRLISLCQELVSILKA